MNKKHEPIDSLLSRQADQQLSAVDWDQLYGRIQNRLDQAEDRSHIRLTKRRWFRWAVGLSAAAAGFVVMLKLNNTTPQPIPLDPGRCAAVQLIEHENRTVAKIEDAAATQSVIVMEPSQKQTVVCFTEPQRVVAQCNVTIVDQNGQAEKENNPRSSWVMMTVSKPAPAENQAEKDQLDIAFSL